MLRPINSVSELWQSHHLLKTDEQKSQANGSEVDDAWKFTKYLQCMIMDLLS